MTPSLFEHMVKVVFGLILTPLSTLAMDPPPNLGRIRNESNAMTMDEAILKSMGGIGVAANMVMEEGSDILAELDMYITMDEFNMLYEPPNPSQMVKMGLMPAPVGAPKDDPRRLYEMPPDYKPKKSKARNKRKAAGGATPWANAEVPYLFAAGHFAPDEEYMMRRSMTEWERYTCLKFKPAKTSDDNVLRFQNGVGCNSVLGMRGGVQVLNLQSPGCRFKGLYLHEIGHALGLVHEHQLPDRDKFIRILYENVSPHMRVWFNTYAEEELQRMKVHYELSSVMHYGITAFSKDGESQTIKAIDPEAEHRIGRVYLKELSYSDVEIVNKFYQCASHCPDQSKCGSDGHLDENCNCICKDGTNHCDKTKRHTVDINCKNAYYDWPCYIWANQGECERNPFYMGRDCAKACGKCGDTNIGTGAQASLHPGTWTWQWFPMLTNMFPQQLMTQQDQCKNTYSETKCAMWKIRGDCVTNSEWMKKHCGETCKMCVSGTRPEENCANTHTEPEKCDRWAMDGECIVNAVFMRDKCAKSCHVCQDDNTDTGTDEDDDGFDEDDIKCIDKNKNCQKWAETGECTRNPPWMVTNCRKSCDKCDDGKCKNLYVDVRCDTWAEQRECISNSQWMGKFCARSCVRGVCTETDRLTTPMTTAKATTQGERTTARPATTTIKLECVNVHTSSTQCDVWAKAGHCEINPSWMLPNCARSCAQQGETEVAACGDSINKVLPSTTTQATGEKTNECEDEEDLCSVWAEAGHCDGDSAVYMLKNCKKSCNNCNGCRDSQILCTAWAKGDHCFQNPGYMMRHCQRSCNACTITLGAEPVRPDGQRGGDYGGNGGASRHHSVVVTVFGNVLCIVVTLYTILLRNV